jgi:PTH1 family peptidyl-tRNA hydrolase
MHRHNVGFMAVDAIAEVHGFEPPKKAFQGWAQQGRIGGERILLLKPATFMNDSGRSVRAAMDFFKKDVGDVTVFHDELDLAPFKVKVKVGGGTAGHNGLRSTEAHIGNEFRRVRIGIGHPGHKDRVTGTCSAITPRPRPTASPTRSARSPPRRSGSPRATMPAS